MRHSSCTGLGSGVAQGVRVKRQVVGDEGLFLKTANKSTLKGNSMLVCTPNASIIILDCGNHAHGRQFIIAYLNR